MMNFVMTVAARVLSNTLATTRRLTLPANSQKNTTGWRCVRRARSTVVTINTIVALILLTPSLGVSGNGIVDLQVGETNKRISTQIRVNSSYFVGASVSDDIYFSAGWGHQYNGGFVLVSVDERQHLSIGTYYRRPKTNWGADIRVTDNLSDSQPKVGGGISYYTGGDDFAITLSYESDKIWLGVRRWM